ncbi:hypothetical protein CapIbe_006495 [Capra ibex]
MTPSPILRKERSDEQSADRCKDTGAAQQSGERNRSRDKARKRRRASGGSSSSGARSRAGSSRGSSSLSASGRSGRSSGSRSSSSSSSSDFPRPWCPRDHGPRSRSKPKPPRRDEKERRRHSPAPKPTKVQVTRLTRKVTREHIREIFSTFGRVREIDLPRERMRAHPSPERRRTCFPCRPCHWSGSSSSSCQRKMENHSGLLQGRQELRGHSSIAGSSWRCS